MKKTINGEKVEVRVIGTYSNERYPIVIVEKGPADMAFLRLAIDWDTGKVIKEFDFAI